MDDADYSFFFYKYVVCRHFSSNTHSPLTQVIAFFNIVHVRRPTQRAQNTIVVARCCINDNGAAAFEFIYIYKYIAVHDRAFPNVCAGMLVRGCAENIHS